MDSSIKHNHTHIKFSLFGTDWVEWLIVGLLCVVTAAGVGLLTGSLVGGARPRYGLGCGSSQSVTFGLTPR